MIIGATLLFLGCLSLYLRYELRYGPKPYLFYGDIATGNPISDAVTWNLHALNLVEGRGFGDYLKQFRSCNYVPPGHPLILSFFYFFLGKDPRAAGWAVALLGSLLPGLAYLWGREISGRRIGLICAALAALHLPYIYIGFSLMSEPTTVFTTAVALWLGARMLRRPGAVTAATAGLVFGFSALVRPSALAFLWGLAIVLLLVRSVPFRRRLLALAMLAVFTLVPLAAWQYRNYRVHGEAAAIYSSISARHAWHGAHPHYGPSFYSRTAWHETLWSDPSRSELAMIKRLQAETAQFIRADRFKYLMSCLWRLKVLFPEFIHRRVTLRWTPGGWGRLHFMGLLAVSLVGLARVLPLRLRLTDGSGTTTEISGALWAGSLILGLGLALAGAGIYGAADRYRWPLEYALLPFAAFGLDGFLRLSRQPFLSRGCFCSTWPPPAPGLRRARTLLLAALAASVTLYASGLIRARHRPAGGEERGPRLSEARLLQAVKEAGLEKEFAAQTPRWITYADVFAEQAAHYGALTSLNRKVVIWWGRLRFLYYDEKGALSGYIILEPTPNDFGGARLWIKRAPNARKLRHHFRDGDVVTVVARLNYEAGPIETPELIFYAMLPGRVDQRKASDE